MRTSKKISILAFVLLTMFIFSACSSSNNKTNKDVSSLLTTERSGTTATTNPTATPNTVKKTTYPLTMKDSYDRTIVIEKEPQRIISGAPNVTEMVAALGKEDKLIGRTDYCDFPESIKSVTSIGDLMTVNIEKIVSLKPDVVIVSNFFDPKYVKKLEDVGIKVIGIYGQESFEGVYETLGKVGLVLNAQDKAEEIIAGMKKKVQSVSYKVKDKTKLNVYYVVEFGANQMTAGKDTFIGQMIAMAGGKNAADDITGWVYSLEKLVEKNPDIMICSKYFDAKINILKTTGYKDLKAVKNNKLFEIDNNILDRQGPRLADGLEALAKIVQPDAFK